MVRLTIKHDYVTLQQLSDLRQCLVQKTSNFLGNALAMLAEEYPEAQNCSDFVASSIISHFVNNNPAKTIWGFPEYGQALHLINSFLPSGSSFKPSLKKIDELRISQRMSFNYLPCNIINDHEGLYFDKLANVSEVLVATLYFYAYYDYSLKQCKLCGKWFATRTAQENFCARSFQYVDCLHKVRSYQNCKDAREAIAARLKGRYNAIYNALYKRQCQYGTLENDQSTKDFIEFSSSAQSYRDRIKSDPSIGNLSDYEKFLYIDCNNYYSRYSRR